MSRFLIFAASLFLAFVAISSASTASASDWKRAALQSHSALAMDQGSGVANEAPWTTVPAPGLVAFVLIHV